MRFTLADLKKTISRRKGEPHLVPFLLRPGDLTEQLDALIALFEAHVGRERVYFPEDRLAELIGDYRLARCLVICLSEWYEWRAPEWPEGTSETEAAALAARDIDSPGALRLALYDHVNATAGGYLASDERDDALDAFAASLGLARSTLDDLLRLDAEPQTVLACIADAAPTAAELAARYNQRAVETVLANASVVEWIIAPERDSNAESLGTLVKRACFLARRMGVQYDVTFDSEAPPLSAAGNLTPRHLSRAAAPPLAGEGVGGEVPALPCVAEHRALYAIQADAPAAAEADEPETFDTTLDTAAQPLVLTLYGPQELTGAPTQYGERLTRLCRALLGYRRDVATRGRAALAGGGLQGSARVYLHGRPLTFTLDDRLLRLLSPSIEAGQPVDFPSGFPLPAGRGPGGEDPYDSSLERRLAEEWASLEREQATAGWRLEREPEPILVGATILVPDFALRRDGRRVFLEIAGYWRPEYRERKLRKLAALRGAVPLLLAAPEIARAEFAALAGQLPIQWYRSYLSAPALLAVLERDYNDFEARLARLDVAGMRAKVTARGRIPPIEAYALLRCYTRAEVARAVVRLDAGESSNDAAPRWIEALGLCAPVWHDALLAHLRALVAREVGARIPLAALAGQLAAERAELADLPEPAIEALARQAGLQVARTSLFAAEVFIPSEGTEQDTLVPRDETTIPAGGIIGRTKSQPRREAKRKLTEPSYSTASMFEPDSHQGEDGYPPREGGTRGRQRK